jgi:hypothetical protein
MVATVLYLVFAPSALIAVLGYCAASRASLLWKWAAWTAWWTATILGGLSVFDVLEPITAQNALVIFLFVFVWSMIAASMIVSGGPVHFARDAIEVLRRKTPPSGTSACEDE